MTTVRERVSIGACVSEWVSGWVGRCMNVCVPRSPYLVIVCGWGRRGRAHENMWQNACVQLLTIISLQIRQMSSVENRQMSQHYLK